MSIRIAPKNSTAVLTPTHRFNHFGYLTYEHEYGVTFPLLITGKEQKTDMKSTSLCAQEIRVSVRKSYTCKQLFLNSLLSYIKLYVL
jgi:hypothetical protein